MIAQIEFRPLASADVVEAFSWYEAQHPEFLAAFEADLDRTLAFISAFPNAAPLVHRVLRRAVLHRFPFAVYFAFRGDLAEIRAVLHTSRSPATWRRRA